MKLDLTNDHWSCRQAVNAFSAGIKVFTSFCCPSTDTSGLFLLRLDASSVALLQNTCSFRVERITSTYEEMLLGL